MIKEIKKARPIPSYLFLQNKAMQRAIEQGRAIDVSSFPRTRTGEFILPEFLNNFQYVDTSTEQYIFSIGKQYGTGEIHAATNTRLYKNPGYICLWVKNPAIYQ